MTQAIQWAVDQEDVVVTTLVTFLQSAAAGLQGDTTTGQPNIAVLDDWPESDLALVAPSVTVLRAGDPDIDELDQVPIDQGVLVAGTTNLFDFTYRIGQATLQLQIDVWATSKMMRGDALARVRNALFLGKDVTLKDYYESLPVLQRPVLPNNPIADNGIVLQLLPPYAIVLADYSFTSGARLDEGPNATGVTEWRATLSGEATYDVVRTARAPRLLAPSTTPIP